MPVSTFRCASITPRAARDMRERGELLVRRDHRRQPRRDHLVFAADLARSHHEDRRGDAGIAQRDALFDQARAEPIGGARIAASAFATATAPWPYAIGLDDRVRRAVAATRAHRARVRDDRREIDLDARPSDHDLVGH